MAKRIGKRRIGEVISHVEARLRQYTQEVMPPALWFELIDSKVALLHGISSTAEKMLYRDNIVLTNPTAGTGGLVTVNLGCTYTNATKTIYVPGSTFLNSFHAGITRADEIPIGSEVLIVDAGERVKYLATFVESTPTSNTFTVRDAYGYNLSSAQLQFAVIIPYDSDNIDLSKLSGYSDIDQVLSIYSTQIADECREMESLAHFFSVKKSSLSYNYRNQVIWIRDGEVLRFAKGTGVPSYGTRTMYFTRRPYKTTVLTEMIDLPESMMDMLYDTLTVQALQVLGQPLPDVLAQAESKMNALIQSDTVKRTEKKQEQTDN